MKKIVLLLMVFCVHSVTTANDEIAKYERELQEVNRELNGLYNHSLPPDTHRIKRLAEVHHKQRQAKLNLYRAKYNAAVSSKAPAEEIRKARNLMWGYYEHTIEPIHRKIGFQEGVVGSFASDYEEFAQKIPSGNKVVVIGGFSGLGYDDPKALKEHIEGLVRSNGPNVTYVLGGTDDGIGQAYDIIRRTANTSGIQGVQTAGVVSMQAAEWGGIAKMDILLPVDSPVGNWEVLGKDGESLFVKLARDRNGAFVYYGGGGIAQKEITEALEKGIPVHLIDDPKIVVSADKLAKKLIRNDDVMTLLKQKGLPTDQEGLAKALRADRKLAFELSEKAGVVIDGTKALREGKVPLKTRPTISAQIGDVFQSKKPALLDRVRGFFARGGSSGADRHLANSAQSRANSQIFRALDDGSILRLKDQLDEVSNRLHGRYPTIQDRDDFRRLQTEFSELIRGSDIEKLRNVLKADWTLARNLEAAIKASNIDEVKRLLASIDGLEQGTITRLTKSTGSQLGEIALKRVLPFVGIGIAVQDAKNILEGESGSDGRKFDSSRAGRALDK